MLANAPQCLSTCTRPAAPPPSAGETATGRFPRVGLPTAPDIGRCGLLPDKWSIWYYTPFEVSCGTLLPPDLLVSSPRVHPRGGGRWVQSTAFGIRCSAVSGIGSASYCPNRECPLCPQCAVGFTKALRAGPPSRGGELMLASQGPIKSTSNV